MAHAEQILRDLLQNIAADQKFTAFDLQVTPISTGGANYTSHIFLATVSEGKKELNVFAKVAAIGGKLRAQFPMELYHIERFFYTELLKVFRQLEEKNNISEEDRLKVPAFYGCNGKLYEETIVLENLVSKGYSAYDRFQTVDWEYAASAVTELAKFHALSVAYHVDDPESFEKALTEITYDFSNNNGEQVWQNFVDKAVEVTKEENKEKLKRFFNNEEGNSETYMQFLTAAKVAVFGHGDYRPSNLMHKVLEDGSVEVIAVDYQTLRGGSPVLDLFYFIFTGTDEQFRAQYYEKLLDHYYSQFRAAMTRLGLKPDDHYSRDDFEFELNEKLPYGLVVAVSILPLVTVEAENAPKLNEEMELSDFSVKKTSSQFPERLNGVVDDFVRWGLLI